MGGSSVCAARGRVHLLEAVPFGLVGHAECQRRARSAIEV